MEFSEHEEYIGETFSHIYLWNAKYDREAVEVNEMGPPALAAAVATAAVATADEIVAKDYVQSHQPHNQHVPAKERVCPF